LPSCLAKQLNPQITWPELEAESEKCLIAQGAILSLLHSLIMRKLNRLYIPPVFNFSPMSAQSNHPFHINMPNPLLS
jgi:hypothetical protein